MKSAFIPLDPKYITAASQFSIGGKLPIPWNHTLGPTKWQLVRRRPLIDLSENARRVQVAQKSGMLSKCRYAEKGGGVVEKLLFLYNLS